MAVPDQLEQDLAGLLSRLYDPGYQPSEVICGVLGCDPHSGPIPVQSIVAKAIDAVKDSLGLLETARSTRMYEVLYDRYVLQLTLEDTAERLDVSVGTVQRDQRRAIHALAGVLWERFSERGGDPGGPPGSDAAGAPIKAADVSALSWHDQLGQELASLQSGVSSDASEVGEVVERVLALERAFASQYSITLKTATLTPNLFTTVHPTALRQILVMAIGVFLRQEGAGELIVSAQDDGGWIAVTLHGALPPGHAGPDIAPIEDILYSQGGEIEAKESDGGLWLHIRLPSVGDTTVLVVDDNPDMVHFYRRCAEGSRYRIVHERLGRHVLEAVAQHKPAVIVLDVMLPDIDGWELLSSLTHHPDTDSIPIIVCSVIREQELGLALGASAYLAKPFDHRQFLQTLSRVKVRTSTE